MGDHLSRAVKVEAQRAEKPCRDPQVPAVVVEGHAVEVEPRKRVTPHDPGVEPATEDPGGVFVLVEAKGLVAFWQLDVDGVVRTRRGEPGPFGRTDHVVRRRHDSVGIHAGRVVTDRSEGFQAGHRSCVAHGAVPALRGSPIVTWLLDCDGVVWLSEQVIAGAPQALASLRDSGSRVVLLTNNSYARRSDHLAKLERLGMPTDPADVLTSAMAAALLLEAGERALVLGGPGIIEELTERGVATVRPGTSREIGPVDAVVVGLDPFFDFSSLAAAAAALHAGARLIGTNDDPSLPTPAGRLPGAGSLLAAVACAGGVTATIAGKPYPATVGLVRERIGEVEMVVGDRPSTDGILARRLDARFGLVLTGITPARHGRLDPEPDLEAADLLALVRSELG